MKKAKSAVRYGIERLKLSPDELFKLIESSQGYDGDDYSRWLAGKIIEVAEADGVQFSQLLVNKFNIINEILEDISENAEIREGILEVFKSLLNEDLYSAGFNKVIGKPLDVDWYNGLDLGVENSFFVNEKLPLELKEKILENEKMSILFKLSLDSADKKTDLYNDAKGQGITLTSKGSMLLYRLCSMAINFDLSNMKFGLVVPVKFLYDKDNESILEYMLNIFKVVEGYSVSPVVMYSNTLTGGNIAFLTLKTRGEGDRVQDGIQLTTISLDEDEPSSLKKLETKRYSKSSECMIAKIKAEAISEEGGSMSFLLEDDVEDDSNVYGYLNIDGSGGLSLSSIAEEGKKNIPINEKNINDIIAYYGVTVSREVDWGYSTDIPCLIDGKVGYEDLLFSCFPLFLFDVNVNFKNGDGYTNKLDVMNSEVIKSLLDLGMPFFSFEAKELFNTCRDYIKFSEENMGVTGKSFHELRAMSDNADFNSFYESKLENLKAYVNVLSKDYL
ncbi:hypothetical protein ACEE21_15250 [Clostridium baratii]